MLAPLNPLVSIQHKHRKIHSQYLSVNLALFRVRLFPVYLKTVNVEHI